MTTDNLPKSTLSKSEICDAYRSGLSIRAVASQSGVTFQRVHAILKECGVALRARSVKGRIMNANGKE